MDIRFPQEQLTQPREQSGKCKYFDTQNAPLHCSGAFLWEHRTNKKIN